MSVRFVVGRAGSGKTWRCLEAIRGRLREHAACGNRLLLIVPEQASFQMERALIETPGLGGYTRCEVLSFQRLAYRIFAETGADPRRGDQTIGALGRMMVMRRLIRRERVSLQLLDRVADKPGLIKQLAGTIDELMRENVEPQVLADLAEKSAADNPLAAAKLADVTRLYSAYLDYLIDDRLDPAQYLTLAAERLERCAWITGAEVWVDGFAGFTRQEADLLIELARRVQRLEIALLVDPSASALETDTLPGLSFSLFARTERTLVRLRNDLRAAGVPVDEPVRLGPRELPRFQAPELAALERNLFGEQEHSKGSHGSASPQVIRVLELPDRRSEVEAAVAEIHRLTREADPPMRYRDIAVIVRDLEPYHDLLSAAMRSAGIPCFIDRRQPTVHHPLIELVRSLLAIATDDCRLESVRLTLKTGLLPIGTDDADLLENYLLAHGIAGRARWMEPWRYTRFFSHKGENDELSEPQRATLARVNEIRASWMAAVGPWLETATAGPEMTGRAWASALFGCLEHLGAGERLHAWATRCEADGLTDEAQVHRQVWADFLELLDEFVKALNTESMGMDPFRETIEAGLSEFDLGLAPPTLDQVLVGAIERSRHPALRAALILGFDQAHFPMRRSEDPLLGDQEREALESAGASMGPSRRRQLLDERMLAYVTLTRASERLWVSYPRIDADGQPVQPSPFLDEVLAAVGGELKVERISDPRARRSPIWLTRVSELGARLADELRYRSVAQQEPEPQTRAIWNALYEAARNRQEWHQTLRWTLAGLKYCNTAELEPGLMARAVGDPFVASVSRLEQYAACPFAHFANYTLGLGSRVEADLAAVDVGTLCHAILEKFVAELAGADLGLAELEDDEIAERIDAAAGEVLPQLSDEMMLAEARNAYLLDRSRGYMARVTRWQRDAARVGRFRPRAVEFPFGYSGHPAAPLTLTTPRGRTIRLRGKIDRVDVADLGDELLGMVIDYKTATERRLDLTKVVHGLSLQLVGYLLALQQAGESLTGRPIRPVAALYLPLLERFESVAHPSREKKERYQWRGIVDAEALPSLDRTVADKGRSDFLSARIKKDGEPYVTSDLARRDQMAALMRHVGLRMGELADGLLDGKIDVSPYRLRRQMPCRFCEYQSVCRYEIETQPPRVLDVFDKTGALRLVAGGGRDD